MHNHCVMFTLYIKKELRTVFCDNNICVGTAILVYMVHGLLHAVYHLKAALKITVLCTQRLGLRRAKGQVGGKPRTCMNLDLMTER